MAIVKVDFDAFSLYIEFLLESNKNSIYKQKLLPYICLIMVVYCKGLLTQW